MLVKLLLIVGLIGALAWWQLRDLAREKEQADAQNESSRLAGLNEDADRK